MASHPLQGHDLDSGTASITRASPISLPSSFYKMTRTLYSTLTLLPFTPLYLVLFYDNLLLRIPFLPFWIQPPCMLCDRSKWHVFLGLSGTLLPDSWWLFCSQGCVFQHQVTVTRSKHPTPTSSAFEPLRARNVACIFVFRDYCPAHTATCHHAHRKYTECWIVIEPEEGQRRAEQLNVGTA